MRFVRPVHVATLGLAVALGCALSPSAHAMCAMVVANATIITPLGAPIPRDGSLLVRVDLGFSPGSATVQPAPGNTYRLSEVALVRAGTRIPLVARDLRAGLARLELAEPPPEGEYELVGFAPAGLAVTIGGALPPAPAAPVVRRARHEERTSSSDGPRGPESSTHWTTTLTLGEALPAHIALVATRPAGRPGANQVFEPAGGRSVVTSTGHLGGHCGMGFVLGRGRAWRRMRAEAISIDVFGRVSPASSAFTVE